MHQLHRLHLWDICSSQDKQHHFHKWHWQVGICDGVEMLLLCGRNFNFKYYLDYF
jgi:hypothetical protein